MGWSVCSGKGGHFKPVLGGHFDRFFHQVHDSNYWYNRNLVIISNIERQFLHQTDLNDIHYYFGKHRNVNSIQTSLKIQLYLVWGIVAAFSIYHFFNRILPVFKLGFNYVAIDWLRCLPYVLGILFYLFVIVWIKKKRQKDYLEMLDNSPGISVDTTEIKYGGGHPV